MSKFKPHKKNLLFVIIISQMVITIIRGLFNFVNLYKRVFLVTTDYTINTRYTYTLKIMIEKQ